MKNARENFQANKLSSD